MKAFCSVTKQFFAQLFSDAMLIVLIFVPILMGLVFRFAVPLLERYLCTILEKTTILSAYYPVFDLLLSVMTPIMFTAAGAMVILDEADLGLSRAIAVTPVGRSGYLASRIGVPSVISTIYCIFVTLIFRLSDLSAFTLILLALCSGFVGIMTAMAISTFAKNKVEGLAYSKLSGLFVLGLPAALLVPGPAQYIAGILPTFWMTNLILGGSFLNAVLSILVSLLWIFFLTRYFLRKTLS